MFGQYFNVSCKLNVLYTAHIVLLYKQSSYHVFVTCVVCTVKSVILLYIFLSAKIVRWHHPCLHKNSFELYNMHLTCQLTLTNLD